ncbi:MAG: GNAT family N-acetyltransferase [Flavobacteriaceae bacterium]
MEFLKNTIVRLEPLVLEHTKLLLPIAMEKDLVQYSPSDIGSQESLQAYISKALSDQANGKTLPYAVFDMRERHYAGCTRFMNIDKENKVVEIGSTWIGRAFQGTGLNTAMKQLMLDYAFNELRFEKVEFRIDQRNTRSRKAVEKLGALLEGVLRENVFLLDGYKRNTCCYGILKKEWASSSIT